MDLLEIIPEELRETETTQLITPPGEHQKTLGIHWDTAIHVATAELTISTQPTKRKIISSVAKTFDLMGWFSPALVVAKVMVQDLWKEGMTWDEPAPVKISDAWRTW